MRWIGRRQSENVIDETNVTSFVIKWAEYNSSNISGDVIIFPDGNFFINTSEMSTTTVIQLIPYDKKFTFTEGHKKAIRTILKRVLFFGKMVQSNGGGAEVEEFFRAFLMNVNG